MSKPIDKTDSPTDGQLYFFAEINGIAYYTDFNSYWNYRKQPRYTDSDEEVIVETDSVRV